MNAPDDQDVTRPPSVVAEADGTLLPESSGADETTVPTYLKPRLDHSAFAERTDSGLPLRYRIDGEIARGGMGVVLKGRDPDLGRDVAIKVLREDLLDNEVMVSRFIEEAQIGGQLQHPGIVPIHELGMLDDQRPFFSMKLVDGRTFAAVLEHRTGPSDALPHFLSIFQSIARTVAYAHSRGVIHRDLKPANIMIGSFGEVQVMDWGLAKVVGADSNRAEGHVPAKPLTTTRGDADSTELSRAGAAIGTPAYMPPEQARGERERIDERADVFSLGSILCEILTGKPAIRGESAQEVLALVKKGDLADAFARLDALKVDGELVALTRECLAPEPQGRPRHAGLVADRITDYLDGVQERLRTSERDLAVAEAKTVEERKRRRLQLGLAASLLAFVTLGGLGTALMIRQRAARAESVAKLMEHAVTLRDVARAHPEVPADWKTALAAAMQAETLASGEAAREVAELVDEIRRGLGAAERDRVLRETLVEIRADKADDPHGTLTEAAYASAFREAGLDLDVVSPQEAGAWIKAKPIAVTVAAALDDWASLRRDLNRDAAGTAKLTEIAKFADPDPRRLGIRSVLSLTDRAKRGEALKRIAADTKVDDLEAASIDLLSKELAQAGEVEVAEMLLRRAQRRHSGDVWINFDLARLLKERGRSEEAVRYFAAARAVVPESAHQLSHTLADIGETDEGIEVLRDLVRLSPRNPRHLACLGAALKSRGKTQEAEETLRRAVDVGRELVGREPQIAGHHAQLAGAYRSLGRLDEAVASYREAIRLRPNDGEPRANLALALRSQGKLEEAEASIREAVVLQPVSADFHNKLGVILKARERLDEAIEAYRESIRLRPDFPDAHFNLGQAYWSQNKTALAEASFREAIRLKPDAREAHLALGVMLSSVGRKTEAEASLRRAIQLGPEDASAHYNLGNDLVGMGKLAEAVSEFCEATRLRPDWAQAHCNLGKSLTQSGEFEEALKELRKGHELGMKQPGWQFPSALWVKDAERDLALFRRLPALLKGEDRPRDAEESQAIARICSARKLHAAAARFWSEALAADPKLADDVERRPRFLAACAAALAGMGRGDDNPHPDGAERARLRRSALSLLRLELEACRATLSQPGRPGQLTRSYLASWSADPELAGLRDPKALSTLDPKEREEWEQLWKDLERALAG